MKEAKLGITQYAVYRSPKDVAFFSDKGSHVSVVTRKISLEQQHLYQYLANALKLPLINNNFMFKLGCVLTYGIIPQSHKAELLTPDQISAAHRSIFEHSKKILGGDGGIFNLTWARNKLKEDSPPFLAWMDIISKGIEKDQDRAAFLLGVMSTVIPFLMRAEARAMEQKIFGKEDNNKS